MEDLEKTIAPDWKERGNSAADVLTLPGRRDRNAEERFQVGDLVMGRYKILAELGRGGMGGGVPLF